MKQLLLVVVLFARTLSAGAQKDTATAERLQSIVERIEENLEDAVELAVDTAYIEKDGTMNVYTRYYYDRGSREVQKITEKTLFGTITTEITVYYFGRSPVLFSTKQWQGSQLKIDFDYYFQANSPIYLEKRQFGKGNPESNEILKWCTQLLNESESKKHLVKSVPEKQPVITGKKVAPKVSADSTKKTTTTKKPLLPFFKKKKN
jgi:hypothetical protein